MKRYASSATICFLATTLFSCGKRQDTHIKDVPSVKPLIVVMGGFTSCRPSVDNISELGPTGMRMFTLEEDLRDHLTEKYSTTVDTIVSCFTQKNELRYVQSADFSRIETNVDPSNFVDLIRDRIERYSHVYIIGHSYGGWMTMRTIAGYEGSPDRIKAYYSLDPISRPRCQITDPSHWSECIKAPSDISEEDRTHIHNKTTKWYNGYELLTPFLHSGHIAQAHVNKRFDVQHWTMDTVGEAWANIRDDADQSF